MGDLQRSYERVKQDHQEQADRYQALQGEKQELAETLAEREQQLRETALQRDQLQKKLSYVEELNRELTELAAAGSKLEAHVKRIAELESMLHLVSEERDWLARQQQPY
jgi:predicted nuclease with TOPRIM domain